MSCWAYIFVLNFMALEIEFLKNEGIWSTWKNAIWNIDIFEGKNMCMYVWFVTTLIHQNTSRLLWNIWCNEIHQSTLNDNV